MVCMIEIEDLLQEEEEIHSIPYDCGSLLNAEQLGYWYRNRTTFVPQM